MLLFLLCLSFLAGGSFCLSYCTKRPLLVLVLVGLCSFGNICPHSTLWCYVDFSNLNSKFDLEGVF